MQPAGLALGIVFSLFIWGGFSFLSPHVALCAFAEQGFSVDPKIYSTLPVQEEDESLLEQELLEQHLNTAGEGFQLNHIRTRDSFRGQSHGPHGEGRGQDASVPMPGPSRP